MSLNETIVTAALVIIGNEILSGRTQDVNLNHIALTLGQKGIRMMECRVVPDIEEEVVDAVNSLRAKFDYVFTTGGIGPTHDDITAACIAKAVGQKLIQNPEAYRLMAKHYEQMQVEFTKARARMANTPEQATLIDNPVSVAPGFKVENIYVMAGVPKIMQAMLENILPDLTGGDKMHNRTIMCNLPEGEIAPGLGDIQKNHLSIDIGSYPAFGGTGFRVSLVLRGINIDDLEAALKETKELVSSLGGEWQDKT